MVSASQPSSANSRIFARAIALAFFVPFLKKSFRNLRSSFFSFIFMLFIVKIFRKSKYINVTKLYCQTTRESIQWHYEQNWNKAPHYKPSMEIKGDISYMMAVLTDIGETSCVGKYLRNS